MSSKSESGGGIGLCGVLGILFVTLKLCGVIDWSWWAVTLPFWWWVPILLVLAAIWFVGRR